MTEKHRKHSFVFKRLENCDKEQDSFGVSEYDRMMTLKMMPNEFTTEEFNLMLAKVLRERACMSLVEKGLLELVYDDLTGETIFRAKDGLF